MKNIKGLVFGEEFELQNLNQKIYFSWLSKQENCLLFDERYIVKLSYLFTALSLKKNIHISKFYLILNKANISKIFSLSFSDPKVDNQFDALCSLYEYFEDKHFILCSIPDQVFLYFPAQIGNVFSKKRYLYEINAYYIYSFKSYKSIDGNRKISSLNYWRIEEEQAMLNEYFDNSASNFHQSIAYLDFIDFYKWSSILITEYFEYTKNLLDYEEFNQIFNILNQLYFEFVTLQQINLVNAMIAKHDIHENMIKGESKKSISEIFYQILHLLEVQKNKMDKKTYQQIHSCLIKWKYKASQSKIHTRSHNLDQIILSAQSDDCDRFVWDNILRYFLYDNYTSYVNTALSRLLFTFHNKRMSQIKDTMEAISLSIFGKESPLYDNKDNRKVFFKEVGISFYPYFNKGLKSSDIKYFLNETIEDSIEKIFSKLTRV